MLPTNTKPKDTKTHFPPSLLKKKRRKKMENNFKKRFTWRGSSPKLPNSFTKETDKIPYHTHHKADSILSGIDEHVRFMADE